MSRPRRGPEGTRSFPGPAEEARDLVAVARDPRVDGRGEPASPGYPKQRGQPAPSGETSEDLGDGSLAREDAPVRKDEVDRLHAPSLLDPGEARASLGGLAREKLELAPARPPGDPGDAPTTERAGAVVDDHGRCHRVHHPAHAPART